LTCQPVSRRAITPAPEGKAGRVRASIIHPVPARRAAAEYAPTTGGNLSPAEVTHLRSGQAEEVSG